jgi:hypothetical protein
MEEQLKDGMSKEVTGTSRSLNILMFQLQFKDFQGISSIGWAGNKFG